MLNPFFDFGTFLIFVLPKLIRARGSKHGVDSHLEFWMLVVHLLKALFVGEHPVRDHLGRSWNVGSFEGRRALDGSKIVVGGFFRCLVLDGGFAISRG